VALPERTIPITWSRRQPGREWSLGFRLVENHWLRAVFCRFGVDFSVKKMYFVSKSSFHGPFPFSRMEIVDYFDGIIAPGAFTVKLPDCDL